MFASTTIANELIARNPHRNAMGICKLTYLAQGWSLAFDTPMVADMPHYYLYGPIHPPVYEMLCKNLDASVGTPHPVPGATTIHRIPEDETAVHNFLDELTKIHSKLSDLQLSTLCHAKGTPFEIATRNKKWKTTLLNTPMDETSMRIFFRRIYDSRDQQAA